MSSLHHSLGNTLVALGATGTAWVAALWVAGRAVSPGLRAFARLCVLAVVVQGALGVALAVHGERPAQPLLHAMYGVAVLLFTGGGVAVSTRLDDRGERAAAAVAMVALLLLAVRAVGSGTA